jgi:hypothetical protein
MGPTHLPIGLRSESGVPIARAERAPCLLVEIVR